MKEYRKQLEEQVPDFCKGFSIRVLHALMQEYGKEMNEPYFKRQLHDDLFCSPMRKIPNLGKVGKEEIYKALGPYKDLPRPKDERFSNKDLTVNEIKEGEFVYLQVVYKGKPYRLATYRDTGIKLYAE